MAIVTTDNQHYSDIADAIREKGVSGSFKPSEMAAAIEAIPSGGKFSEDDDVCFWDFDGTPIYSCSLEEAQSMTPQTMPQPPEHIIDGIQLDFCYYNWTDEEFAAISSPGDLVACYKPHDEKLHFKYSTILAGTKEIAISGYMRTANQVVTVDWGDGNVENFTFAIGQKHMDHTYTDDGVYRVSAFSANSWNIGGSNAFIRDIAQTVTLNKGLVDYIIYPERSNWDWPGGQGNRISDIGPVTQIVPPPSWQGTSSGAGFQTLHRISYEPRGSGNDGGVRSSHPTVLSLRPKTGLTVTDKELTRYYCGHRLIIPDGKTTLDRFGIRTPSASIQKFYISNTMQDFGEYGLSDTGTVNEAFFDFLRELRIPASVTAIRAAFSRMSRLLDLYCYPETPPSAESVSLRFSNFVKIHVPAASLQAYQEATNWSAWADNMVGDL